MRETMVLGKSTTGKSNALWASCPWGQIANGTRRGTIWFDDFDNVAATPTNTTSLTGKYAVFTGATGTNTITQGAATPVANGPHGEVVFTLNATDDMACVMQAGGGVTGAAEAVFVDPLTVATNGIPRHVWFEARFKLTSAGLTCASFFGLMKAATPTATSVISSDVLADTDLIGFSTLPATPTILNWTYKKNGQTVQVPLTTAKTMVSGTYVKAGFLYNYLKPAGKQITCYIDGAEQSTYITSAMIQAATFPDSLPMALTAAVKNSAATAHTATMDWWSLATLEV